VASGIILRNLRRLSLVLIILGGIAVGALLGFYPDLDLRLAAYFFDPNTTTFIYAANPVIVSLRNLNSAIDIAIGVILALAMIQAYLVPAKQPIVSRRTVVFLVTTFLLAPVFFANVVFKENWGRPRPYHVSQHGGASQFVAWWDPRGTCKRSCSFFSGEVSAAAWTMGPAVLLSGPPGVIAVAASILFTISIAVVRMAQGGHFFSDAAIAALFTWLIVWIAYGFFFLRLGARSGAPDPHATPL
jgi:lipid A 4'-phosphatase